MQCLILAGGLGTRVKGITGNKPKALIPVLGKPFAYHQLQLLKKNGIDEVVFSIGYLGEQIEEYCAQLKEFNIKFQFVYERGELLGTGGAIRHAIDNAQMDSEFFVIYGDSYLPVPFRPIWNSFHSTSAPALMTVFLNQGQWDNSNVEFQADSKLAPLGKVIQYQKNSSEKLNYIDYGLSLWRKSTIQDCVAQGQKQDLSSVFVQLCREKKLVGFEVFQRFYEVGSPAGVKDLENYLRVV